MSYSFVSKPVNKINAVLNIHSLFVAEITSKFHCDDSHECKIAEVDKLQDFTGQFKVTCN